MELITTDWLVPQYKSWGLEDRTRVICAGFVRDNFHVDIQDRPLIRLHIYDEPPKTEHTHVLVEFISGFVMWRYTDEKAWQETYPRMDNMLVEKLHFIGGKSNDIYIAIDVAKEEELCEQE